MSIFAIQLLLVSLAVAELYPDVSNGSRFVIDPKLLMNKSSFIIAIYAII